LFDGVVSAYLIRNLPPDRLLHGLREQVRVVKPGGRIVCLDATPPPRGFFYPLIRFYLDRVIPLLGTLIAGQHDAYSYLPRSAQAFRTGDELARLMRSAGLGGVTYRTFLFGTMTLLVGARPLI
jgi:demethylmenaquinone methyltransferase/2-methoxy-6-polyprenyl-1,4-benzoquinol methylase